MKSNHKAKLSEDCKEDRVLFHRRDSMHSHAKVSCSTGRNTHHKWTGPRLWRRWEHIFMSPPAVDLEKERAVSRQGCLYMHEVTQEFYDASRNSRWSFVSMFSWCLQTLSWTAIPEKWVGVMGDSSSLQHYKDLQLTQNETCYLVTI